MAPSLKVLARERHSLDRLDFDTTGMIPRTSLQGLPIASIVKTRLKGRWTGALPTRNSVQGDKDKRGSPSHTKEITPNTSQSQRSAGREKPVKTDDSQEIDNQKKTRGSTQSSNTKETDENQTIARPKEQLNSKSWLSSAVTEDYNGDSSEAKSGDEEGMGWGTKPVSRNIGCTRRMPQNFTN